MVKTIKWLALALLLGAGAGGWAAPPASGAFHGGAQFRGGGQFHGGGHFRGGDHFRGGGWHGRGSVVIGGPLFWPPYYYYPYPYAYPYGAPYPYYGPPVVAAPPTYVEQGDDDANQYWYFCSNPKGYYPYVKECPPGWVQVTPQPPAGN